MCSAFSRRKSNESSWMMKKIAFFLSNVKRVVRLGQRATALTACSSDKAEIGQ